jgi:acylphosphatase
VRGRVQGVGFRASCARRARDMGLAGWVRNLPDGSVEAVFEGDDDQVDAITAWCGRGPSMAKVEGVETFAEHPAGDGSGFHIR